MTYSITKNVGENNNKSFPLISVIIPVYDVEAYLCKCVDSVINQTYQNLEIILVDDGSPDGCGSICDDYANKYNHIHVIHKINGGLSSARNAGVDVANGEWIGFVDSDDYCHPQMYEKLYNTVKINNADMAICGYNHVDEQGLPAIGKSVASVDMCVLVGDEALRQLCGHKYHVWVTAVNKLYKRSLFTTVRFPEGRLHEDLFTVHLFFDKCERIAAISEPLYNYTQRTASIMHKPFSINRLDLCFALLERYYFYKEKGSSYNKCAAITMQICGGFLCRAISKLGWRENKVFLQPLYRKILPLLIRQVDLRALKLFIWRHRW